MVPFITRQSIIIKCSQQASILLGNYEFYYLAGLMKKLFGFQLNAEMNPQEMFAQIQKEFDTASPRDGREGYLLKLVEFYKPLEEYDEQMKELFHMGEHEERLWQMF
uniref:DUF3837 domain-containing protein n=1 Tax=Agathobacter sp. TaxID=2021311 RepID=UPI004055A170